MFMGQRGKGALMGEARVNGGAGPCFQSVPLLVFTAWMAAGSSGEAYPARRKHPIHTSPEALRGHYRSTTRALQKHYGSTQQTPNSARSPRNAKKDNHKPESTGHSGDPAPTRRNVPRDLHPHREGCALPATMTPRTVTLFALIPLPSLLAPLPHLLGHQHCELLQNWLGQPRARGHGGAGSSEAGLRSRQAKRGKVWEGGRIEGDGSSSIPPPNAEHRPA